MPVFQIGSTYTTPENGIEVTPAATVLPGTHRFSLVVYDEAGNASSNTAIVQVTIRDTRNPTAVINAPAQVQPGQAFRLDGSQSTDVPPGKIAKYVWTMLD